MRFLLLTILSGIWIFNMPGLEFLQPYYIFFWCPIAFVVLAILYAFDNG